MHVHLLSKNSEYDRSHKYKITRTIHLKCLVVYAFPNLIIKVIIV